MVHFYNISLCCKRTIDGDNYILCLGKNTIQIMQKVPYKHTASGADINFEFITVKVFSKTHKLVQVYIYKNKKLS